MMEIRESKTANLFWAVSCLLIGSAFGFSVLFDKNWRIGLIGIMFALGSLLFFWSLFSNSLKAVISVDGIWTHLHRKTIPWNDFKDVGIADGMLYLELSDVNKHFPDTSAVSKRVLKRSVIDLTRTNVNMSKLADYIDTKVLENLSE